MRVPLRVVDCIRWSIVYCRISTVEIFQNSETKTKSLLKTINQSMSRHQNNSSLGFLFGGADTRPKVSANTFATGSNQNCGNFITDRSTVRDTLSLSLDL